MLSRLTCPPSPSLPPSCATGLLPDLSLKVPGQPPLIPAASIVIAAFPYNFYIPGVQPRSLLTDTDVNKAWKQKHTVPKTPPPSLNSIPPLYNPASSVNFEPQAYSTAASKHTRVVSTHNNNMFISVNMAVILAATQTPSHNVQKVQIAS